MRLDEVKDRLTSAGIVVVEESRDGNNTGYRLRLDCNALLNLYDSGKCVVQGKNPGPVRDALGLDTLAKSVSYTIPKQQEVSRKVFVVYGHEQNTRGELEAMLRRWNLDPLILDQIPSGGQTIIEKLESVRQEANYAIVLATPDDVGHRRDHPDERLQRARQNVVLELGMMLALLGRQRVAILLPSSADMERPSDIHGLIYIPYKDSVTEAGLTLAKEIDAQGIHIDLNRV